MFDSRAAIALYRGWSALEKRLTPEVGVEVIDFDLVPEIQDSEPLESRAQVLSRLIELRGQLEVGDETTEFLGAKLEASRHYLESLQGRRAEFYTHVRRLLGVTPELVSEQTILDRQESYFARLASFGVSFAGGRPTETGFASFDDSLLIDRAEGERQAREAVDRFLPAVLDLLGLEGLAVGLRMEFVEERANWKGWASGEKGALQMRLNFHPRHRWRRGDVELLVLHEVCGHAVHAAAMAREIEAGRLDPFAGLTTMHDPHCFLDEGVADALAYYFPGEIELSEEALLVQEQYAWHDYLNNNAHLLVNLGWSEDFLLDYLLRAPFYPEERARQNLEKWRSDPAVYPRSLARKYFETIAQERSRDQRVRLLRHAFTHCVTPGRLLEIAEGELR